MKDNNTTFSSFLAGAFLGALAVTLIDRQNRKRFTSTITNMIDEGNSKMDDLEDTVAQKAKLARKKVAKAKNRVEKKIN